MKFADFVRCLIAVAATGLLGGCIAQVPDDLTFVSVEAVDWHDEAELLGHGTEKQHRLMLKTTFASATDLVQFVQRHSYSLGAGASFCDQSEERVSLAYPPIYWHGAHLNPYDQNAAELSRDPDSASIAYYVYLAAESRERPWHISPGPSRAFDLRKDPRDVCLYVSGGNMSGFGYKSNFVVLPASEIAAALRDVPPAFR